MGKKSKKGTSRAGGKKRSAAGKGKKATSKTAASSNATEQNNVMDTEQAAAVGMVKEAGQEIENKSVDAGTRETNGVDVTRPREVVSDNEKTDETDPKLDNGKVTTEQDVDGKNLVGDHKLTDSAKGTSPSASGLPTGLESSLPLFTPSQQKLAKALCSEELGQSHLFDHWPKLSSTKSPSSEASNKIKIQFMEQLESMDCSYGDGGLAGYVKNARELLKRSQMGVNPLEGWKPSVPTGENVEIGTPEFDAFEQEGLKSMGQIGFVLVAGGLGERLGYSDIKVGLPTEMASETSYIQFYIEHILAIQQKYAKLKMELPLCIMTSGDTNAGTVKLLKENNYFGMNSDQITIVQQGDGVPALLDNDAKFALDPNNKYKLLAKPHGHGDIHALLHNHGVARKWSSKGIKWILFFQDTNGLAFHTLPMMLGVSSKHDLVMNSLAIPRKAKQAIGAIARLEKVGTNEERTINVEYNQLDPLLRATGFPDGDVNDPETGYSPFPGNINELLFRLDSYAKALERRNGIMPEFVNPKYKDETKTAFKKPTRLECMMQDFPTILEGGDTRHVGFCCMSADITFSPVKNSTADGVALQAKGTHPAVAATGEADQYGAVRKVMSAIGCKIEEAEPETFRGITVIPGPGIVVKASFASCPAEYKARFTSPSDVKISAKSYLVVEGDVIIASLDLDGSLVIKCEEGASGVICGIVVKNKGWKRVSGESSSNEVVAMRGYHLDKVETTTILVKKDGTVEKSGPSAQVWTTKVYTSSLTESMRTSGESAAVARDFNVPTSTEASDKEGEDCACVIL